MGMFTAETADAGAEVRSTGQDVSRREGILVFDSGGQAWRIRKACVSARIFPAADSEDVLRQASGRGEPVCRRYKLEPGVISFWLVRRD